MDFKNDNQPKTENGFLRIDYLFGRQVAGKKSPKSVSEVSEVTFWTGFGDSTDVPKSVFEVIKGLFWLFFKKKPPRNTSGRR